MALTMGMSSSAKSRSPSKYRLIQTLTKAALKSS